MLADLIARLEAATWPDRTLDAYIKAAAEGFDPTGKTLIEVKTFTGAAHELVPAYTASLDAALTLVPNGCVWNAGTDGRCWAYVWRDTPEYEGDAMEGRGATPAIALCIAALHARLTMETPNADPR